MAALNDIRPPAREYPHTFWNDGIRRNLIYGRAVDQLRTERWP